MAFGPQPYIPPSAGPRAYIPPPQDINTLIANLRAQQAANVGSLPLTRTLPGLGSGAGDVSALYARPPAAGQLPLTRTLPKIGPGAGDVSELLAPRALNAGPGTPIALGPASTPLQNTVGPNPNASRAIRGGWEYTGTPTTAAPAVPGQQLALGPGSPLPPPPTEPMSLGQTARGILGSVSSSYVPESIASRLPIGGKFIGGMGGNLLGGMLTSIAAGSARNALNASPYANTELGRAGNEGLFATQYGAFGGPAMALASGAGGLTGQLGFASGQGRPIVDTGNRAGNAALQATADTAIGSTPVLGTVYNAGKLLGTGAEALGLGNTLSDLRDNTLGKIPVVGGFFSSGSEQPAAEEPTTPRDYSFNSIRDTATQMGLDPQSTALLEQKYNSTIAYMKGNPVISIADPKTGQIDPADKKSFEDMGYKVSSNGQVQVDDNYIQAAAWNEAYNALPTAQAQALQTADFARKQAALQAALAEQFGTLRDQAGISSTPDYSTWQASIAGLPPEQQAAAQGMLDSQSSWQNRINDAFIQQAAQLPSFLAMNQQVDQANSMAAQIQQAQNQQWLAQMYPDLFGQQSSSSGGLSLNDILTPTGG